MRTLVIGAHGKIGRQLCALAATAGRDVVGMVRVPAQRAAMDALGVASVVADLEGELEHAFADIAQVVFTAGSGPHTGADKTLLIDLWGAVRAVDLAVAHGVQHFIMVSALRAADPLAGPEGLRPYLAAKHAADRILRGAPLHHTIVAPGRLTDEPGTGRISTAADPARGATIPRADVAALLAALLEDPVAADRTVPVVSGAEPIGAVARASPRP